MVQDTRKTATMAEDDAPATSSAMTSLEVDWLTRMGHETTDGRAAAHGSSTVWHALA